MDWDDLRFFLAVAREGSFSSAARVLRVTQPTVGRRIAAFERSLGAKLFVSTANGQGLSPSGRLMLGHAEQMELAALAAERVSVGRDAGLSGRVRITASEWLMHSVLVPLLPRFLDRHPGLEIDLVAEVRHVNLARREAEIALRPSRFEHEQVSQRVVSDVAFGLYASDEYLSRRGMPDFARGSEGHALVAMSESLTKIPDVEWFPKIVSRARVVARTNGREPMATMALSGIGMTCLPRFIGDRTALRLLPTPGGAPVRRLWLGVHRDVRTVPRVRATITHLVHGIERQRHALCPRDA